MKKTGKGRTYRNVAIGWITHSLHSTDVSEMAFRAGIEGVALALTCVFYRHWLTNSLWKPLLAAGITVHTVLWLLDGNFWVYLRPKNPGLPRIIRFLEQVRSAFLRFPASEAILVYGSMCRRQFHDRSDLDLRVIRRKSSIWGLYALALGFLFRSYSFFLRLPVDLQVVDSLEFLDRQMRADEHPILLFTSGALRLNPSMSFDELVKNPSFVLRRTEVVKLPKVGLGQA